MLKKIYFKRAESVRCSSFGPHTQDVQNPEFHIGRLNVCETFICKDGQYHEHCSEGDCKCDFGFFNCQNTADKCYDNYPTFDDAFINEWVNHFSVNGTDYPAIKRFILENGTLSEKPVDWITKLQIAAIGRRMKRWFWEPNFGPIVERNTVLTTKMAKSYFLPWIENILFLLNIHIFFQSNSTQPLIKKWMWVLIFKLVWEQSDRCYGFDFEIVIGYKYLYFSIAIGHF